MAAVAPATRAEESRAIWPGSRRVRTSIIVAIAAALLAAFGYGVAGLVAPRHPSVNYADPQSWLPAQQLQHPIDEVVAGSIASPGLTVEGLNVAVHTAGFRAMAMVSGPVVPGEGLPFQARFTTCTWTVSISDSAGVVPLAMADFDTIDHTGTQYKVYLVPGQAKLPASLHRGQRVSFRLRAVMPTGEGLMRWAPNGTNIVAKWDYQVEND